jgi:hypothetical protein
MTGLVLTDSNSRAATEISEALSNVLKVNTNNYFNKKPKIISNFLITISLSKLSLRVIRLIIRV